MAAKLGPPDPLLNGPCGFHYGPLYSTPNFNLKNSQRPDNSAYSAYNVRLHYSEDSGGLSSRFLFIIYNFILKGAMWINEIFYVVTLKLKAFTYTAGFMDLS